MVDSSPKFKNNTLSEVLLEIRFKPTGSFPLILGLLHEKLSKKYSIVDDLKVPDFPDDPQFDNIVKFRFYSSDRKILYNLGNGILSVNILKYVSYDSFISNVKEVLEKHIEVSGVKLITRIGLRYINKIKPDDSFNETFNLNFILPKKLERIQTDFVFKTRGKIGDNVLSTGIGTYEADNNLVLLDFDCYLKKSMNYSLEDIVKWADASHEIIYSSYKSCISTKYMKKISK